jgi:hypothetical protein
MFRLHHKFVNILMKTKSSTDLKETDVRCVECTEFFSYTHTHTHTHTHIYIYIILLVFTLKNIALS